MLTKLIILQIMGNKVIHKMQEEMENFKEHNDTIMLQLLCYTTALILVIIH